MQHWLNDCGRIVFVTSLLAWSPWVIADDKTAPTNDDLLSVPVLDPVPMPSADAIRQAVDRGVAFLIQAQNDNGSWGAATQTKGLNIYAPLPGSHHAFRDATTALCVSALIEREGDYPELGPVITKAEEFLIRELPKLRRADEMAIYNVWGHAYSLTALARMHQRHQGQYEKQKVISELIEQQYDMLNRYESVDGGWGYYDFRVGTQKPSSDSISFVNAAVLVGMHDTKQLGFAPPEKIVNRALDATERQQKADYSYLYGEYLKNSPMHPVNRPGGSLGRSQACNLALHLWDRGNITDAAMIAWQNRLYARNGWLDIGRKRPIPHESWFAVAGYFYYFGHYYAGRMLHLLPAENQAIFKPHLATLMIQKQDGDGSWWDYPLYSYHQPYGTAFALMTLKCCE